MEVLYYALAPFFLEAVAQWWADVPFATLPARLESVDTELVPGPCGRE